VDLYSAIQYVVFVAITEYPTRRCSGALDPGRQILVSQASEVPRTILTIDLASGQRKLLRSFSVFQCASAVFARPERLRVYQRITSDLYVVDGLK